jgi:hypothetical protein
MTQIFIIQASGSTVMLEDKGIILCRKAFVSKDAAQTYLPQFKVDCTTERDKCDFYCLEDNELLRFTIVGLELETCR